MTRLIVAIAVTLTGIGCMDIVLIAAHAIKAANQWLTERLAPQYKKTSVDHRNNQYPMDAQMVKRVIIATVMVCLSFTKAPWRFAVKKREAHPMMDAPLRIYLLLLKQSLHLIGRSVRGWNGT